MCAHILCVILCVHLCISHMVFNLVVVLYSELRDCNRELTSIHSCIHINSVAMVRALNSWDAG